MSLMMPAGSSRLAAVAAWTLSALTAVGVAVLISVTFRVSATSANLSDVLNRRAPTIEHIACYETRLSGYLAAQTTLVQALLDDDRSDLTPPADNVAAARAQLASSSAALTAATDPTSPFSCPALPTTRDGP